MKLNKSNQTNWVRDIIKTQLDNCDINEIENILSQYQEIIDDMEKYYYERLSNYKYCSACNKYSLRKKYRHEYRCWHDKEHNTKAQSIITICPNCGHEEHGTIFLGDYSKERVLGYI